MHVLFSTSYEKIAYYARLHYHTFCHSTQEHFAQNERTWVRMFSIVSPYYMQTYMRSKLQTISRLYHRLLGARFVCDRCSVKALVVVGFRLLFLLFRYPSASTPFHSIQPVYLDYIKQKFTSTVAREEFCPDHPLLGQRRHNNKGWHLLVIMNRWR